MADIADELAGLDFAEVSPDEFAKIVKKASAKDIAQIMRGEMRQRVLAAIFDRMQRQFRPESAGSLEALVRWKVAGDEGEPEAVYETHITGGTCTVSEGRGEAEPRVTLVMGDAEFLKLVSGNASPVTMFMTRKLKVAGDVALASGLTRYFDIPKA